MSYASPLSYHALAQFDIENFPGAKGKIQRWAIPQESESSRKEQQPVLPGPRKGCG